MRIDGNLTGGIDYYPGPYNVTIKRFSRNSDVFSIGIMRNHYYTGDKYFTLMINDSKLPVPLVACEDNSENITIIDKECKYYVQYNVVIICMFSLLSCLIMYGRLLLCIGCVCSNHLSLSQM